MLEALLAVLGAALVASLIYQYRSRKDTMRQLQEYKELFELADASQKEAQNKLEGVFQDVARKDVLIDRSAQFIETAKQEIAGLKSQLSFQEEQYAKLFNQKKSSEVRTGQIAETMASFLADYPFPPETGSFLGRPIDMIHFLEDKIVLVEIKSGKSQLSSKQRQIKKLIEDGKVEFVIYRVE